MVTVEVAAALNWAVAVIVWLPLLPSLAELEVVLNWTVGRSSLAMVCV